MPFTFRLGTVVGVSTTVQQIGVCYAGDGGCGSRGSCQVQLPTTPVAELEHVPYLPSSKDPKKLTPNPEHGDKPNDVPQPSLA